MSQVIEKLSQDPALSAWIRTCNLSAYFSPITIGRTKAYAHRGPISDLKIKFNRRGEPEVTASIQGNAYRPYQTQLTFFESEPGKLEVESICSCPVGINCKHGAALMILLAKELGHAAGLSQPSGHQTHLPADIERWLASVQGAIPAHNPKTAKRKTQPYSKLLTYCIEIPHSQSYHTSPRLALHPASLKKSGEIRIEETHAQADPMRPAKYMSEDDIPIALLYHRTLRRQHSWEGIDLEGKDGARLIELAMATGRMFASDKSDRFFSYSNYKPVQSGEPIELRPGWELLPSGAARPVLEGLPNGFHYIPTSPPYYLDPSNGTVGPIQSQLAADALGLWETGPDVPAKSVQGLSERLSAEPSRALPAPVEIETETQPAHDPKPHLKLSRKTLGISGDEGIHVIIAEPSFLYGDGPLLPPSGIPCTAREHVQFENGKRIVWPRQRLAENQLIAALLDHGLTSALNHEEINPNEGILEFGYLPENKEPSHLLAWLNWLDGPFAASLLDSGWTIDVDPDAGLHVHDGGDFLPAIHADTDHGIDWFRFDASLTIDGRKQSLIPLIAKAIELDFPAADSPDLSEWIYLHSNNPEEGIIRLPAREFLEIVDQVRHLFHGRKPSNGSLLLDRIAAADLADTFDLDSNATQRSLAKLGRSLKDIRELPKARLPKSVKANLRPYQEEGYQWLRFLAKHELHGILADDMGLGKTLQALAHLAAEHAAKPGKPSLIVAPTSVVLNWAAEAKKFTPTLKALVYHGPQRHNLLEDIPITDLVITSYPLLHRDHEMLAKQPWQCLILDEAQYIKNPKSVTAQAARKLQAAHRLCLSGTPMENHLGELWSLMRFLMPGFLADEKSFNAQIRRPIERDHSNDAQQALNRRVSPLILRRTKDQVATDLPPKTELIHHIDLGKKQIDLYESVRATMDKRVRDAIAAKGLAQSQIIVLDALLKLRQICCHPSLINSPAAKNVTESAKLHFLTHDLLPQLLEEGRRILLFSQFTSMLALIEKHLKAHNIPHLKLTGRTRNRAALVEKFQAGETPIFLISLKAGGTGLNLTAADSVIHYDPWWNPAAENQATDRAHRIGQNKPVFVHKLVCRGSIEDRILELQQRKASLAKALLSEETTSLRINSDTLSHLLAPIA